MLRKSGRADVTLSRSVHACLTLVAFALSLASASVSAAEWQKITNKEARIVFEAPGLDRRSSSKMEGNHSWMEFAGFLGGDGKLPRAVLLHTELWPGYLYNSKQSLKDSVEAWKYFEGETLELSEEKTVVNKLGRISYTRFLKSSADCFGFQSYFGLTSGSDNDMGVPLQVVEGYYCTLDKLSDSQVEAALKSLYVKAR